MTILPTKRTTAASEETKDPSSHPNDTSSNRRPYRRKSTTPEPIDQPSRKRSKKSEQSRRKQRDTRQDPEKTLETVPATPSEPETSTAGSPDLEKLLSRYIETEDGAGFNSEDEYWPTLGTLKDRHLTDQEWSARDSSFAGRLSELGYEIKQMHEDGACLFRAIADQIYGDQELHFTVRTSCMDYIVKNKNFFAAYVTEDFDKYVARKRKWNVHGNHLEIQALSEMYNRTIEVYCYKIEPINIFNGPRITSVEPIRLSYHRMCHYNSINNLNNPSTGIGLGPSQEELIERTMLEDKIKATDWEATDEALEEEVARESYIQYIRDVERRLKPQSSTSVASSSTTTTSTSPKRTETKVPNEGEEGWDDGMMAQALAESRDAYLDELKRNSKRRMGSPGPSTSS